MNNRMLYLIVILTGLSVTGVCSDHSVWMKGDAWPHPKLRFSGVLINSGVVYDTYAFNYYYKVKNPRNNGWPIGSLLVDLRVNPQVHQLAKTDLTSQHTLGEHFDAVKNASGARLSGQIGIPDGWETTADTTTAYIYWRDDGYSQHIIYPGRQMSGFSITSIEPPGIRDFAAYVDVSVFDDERNFILHGKELGFYLNSLEYAMEKARDFECLGKTLAPVPALEPFTVSSWTARMTADAVEARKLRWIKTDKNLLEIKKLIVALKTDDKSALADTVKRIENYVLAEKKKGNLSDEGDALIRLNAQYLLRRLGSSGQ